MREKTHRGIVHVWTDGDGAEQIFCSEDCARQYRADCDELSQTESSNTELICDLCGDNIIERVTEER